jgi:hypothetical protein
MAGQEKTAKSPSPRKEPFAVPTVNRHALDEVSVWYPFWLPVLRLMQRSGT